MSKVQPIRLRCAGHQDARDVFEWRNDPVTRAASHEVAPVPWPVHELWWKASLGRADRALFVAEDAQGRPVGLVRFDARPGGLWLVGVQVAPARRGQGFGRALLAAGVQRMAERRGASSFVAEIKDGNLASQRLFAGLGFQPVEGLTWTLELPARRAVA